MKKLNTFDASLLVMGSMIGSGIFLVSTNVAQNSGNIFLLLMSWLISGLITIIGAISYGKISTLFPYKGGQYIYLKENYSPLVGFLFGWSTFLVIQTGTIAAVAVAFAKYTLEIFPNFEGSIGFINHQELIAALSIILLTLMNLKGVNFSSIIQNIFTIIKILALATIIIIGFYWGIIHDWENFNNIFQNPKSFDFTKNEFIELSPTLTISLFGAALIGPLFSSSAWNNLTFASSDFENPQKNIRNGLLYGASLVVLIYLLTNIAYLGILPFDGNIYGENALERGIMFAQNDRLGSASMEAIFGLSGAIIMAIAIMISTFGCNNGLILSGGRLFEAMANDQLFFKKASILNKNNVPKYSLIIQAFWAILLCFSGSYSELLDFTIFAVLIFYGLTVGIILKNQELKQKSSQFFKIIILIYLISITLIALNLLYTNPLYSFIGLIIVLSGIPVYKLFKNYLN